MYILRLKLIAIYEILRHDARSNLYEIEVT